MLPDRDLSCARGLYELKYFFTSAIQSADGGEAPLRKSLGPVSITAMGIGAIIGAGIFVLTGTVAASNSGPALALSFLIAALACGLAGLCYAEFASTVPVAGSAYTFSYATLGELARAMQPLPTATAAR